MVSAAVLALAVVDLLVLDPAQTVTTDLPRLYGAAGWLGVSWVVTTLAWAAAAYWGVHAATGAFARLGPRGLRGLAASLAVLGGVLWTLWVPMTGTGIGTYSVAQASGFAPAAASAGTLTVALYVAGPSLLLLAGLLALVDRARSSRY